MFATNEGTIDRVVRGVVGVALLVVAFMFVTGVWQIVAGVIGAILLITGVVGFCPLYRLMGISTHAPQPAARR